MQTTTLKVTLENGKVLSDSGLILPCALEELGCETTSLDPYAYIWDYPDNCAISILRTEEVNMVKQGKKYYVISGAESSSKFVFEVKNNPQKHCGKPTSIYPTNYESLCMDRLSECLTWTPGETWVVIKTEQPRSYKTWDQRRKATSVNFMLIIPS